MHTLNMKWLIHLEQENITRKLNLEDEIKLVTGDELTPAIKKLLGEEKIQSSLLQTTGNIITCTEKII